MSIKHCVSIATECVNFLMASAGRKKIFLDICALEKKTRCLKTFCETRWVERHDSILVFYESFNIVLDALGM